MLPPSPRLAIIGTGLIGGSIGRAVRLRMPGTEVVGLDAADVLSAAVELGAIDRPASSMADAVAEADVVLIATPLRSIPAVLREIAPLIRPGTIVTDVGSVKASIVELAREVLPDTVTFVGGHPMAGSAAGGIEQADPLLFENAVYVLTSDQDTLPDQAIPLLEIIETLGARVLLLPPDIHDRVAASVSHLPQMIAVMLVEAAFDFGGDEDLVSTLAAGGFRDMTRIAESPFRTWEGILAANHGHILDAMAIAASTLQRLRNRLIEEDYQEVASAFERAGRRRRAIPTDMRGFMAPLHRISVALEDRPGALHQLTGALAEAGINIKDIELVKIRDGAAGSFRIGFATAEESRAASVRLSTAGFRVAAV